MTLIKRRIFIKISIVAILGGIVSLWDKMASIQQKSVASGKVSVPIDQTESVTFYDKFIVVKQKGKISVFSSHCTHLGCKIDKKENGKLVCPCHGSAFDMQGKALKGPAYKPLKKLPFEYDKTKKRLLVTIA